MHTSLPPATDFCQIPLPCTPRSLWWPLLTRSGVLRARGGSAVRVCGQAGAAVAFNVLVGDMYVDPARQGDSTPRLSPPLLLLGSHAALGAAQLELPCSVQNEPRSAHTLTSTGPTGVLRPLPLSVCWHGAGRGLRRPLPPSRLLFFGGLRSFPSLPRACLQPACCPGIPLPLAWRGAENANYIFGLGRRGETVNVKSYAWDCLGYEICVGLLTFLP